MTVTTRLILALLVVSVATLAVAADPEPQKPATPPAGGERQQAPALNINQAELEAGVQTEPMDAAKALDGAGTTSPMLTEIQATLELSRLEIAELAARADAATDHDAELALQREIAELKQQAELDVLAIQVRYARDAGNEALAQEIEAAIAAIVSPPTPAAPTDTRPAPSSQ